MTKEAEVKNPKNPIYGITPLDDFLPGGYLNFRSRLGSYITVNDVFKIEKVSQVKDSKPSRKTPRFT